MGGGRAHSFLCHSPRSLDRELAEEVSVSAVFLPSPSSCQGRAESSSHCDGCRPPEQLHPQGAASSRRSQLLQLPTAHLIQGEGEKMGSPVLQGQHPHFQPNQGRKRAQSLTPRGSAFSAWGVGEAAGAAPLLPTQSPGQISRYMSAHKVLWAPEALKSGNWRQRGGSRAKGLFKSRSKGRRCREKTKMVPISPRQSSRPPRPPTALLPTNSLRASGNAFDGASCPFCRVFGLWCGGAGIQSGRGRGRGEEGTRASHRKHPVPENPVLPPLKPGPQAAPGHRQTSGQGQPQG